MDDNDRKSLARPPALPVPVLPHIEGIDKTSWGEGPWQHEPDRVEFIHQGVPCLMFRSPLSGAWNGYAGAEPGHPWHGTDLAADQAEAHGGITWTGPTSADQRMMSDPRRFAGAWWIGFDCAHACDYQPAMQARLREALARFGRTMGGEYRTAAYVRACVVELAEQVIAARRQ